MNKTRVIVDAFGGDNAPLAVVKGCEMAVKALDVEIVLTGDETALKELCEKEGISLEGIEIVNADGSIPVEEDPTQILRAYSNCSMAVGLKLLSQGMGDAFVSAGSTGALVVGASTMLKRIKGVKRAALGTVIPGLEGAYMLTDLGANTECRPEMLVQFGIMGSTYMKKIMGVENPRVALVNIGAEETKGTQLQVEAYPRMKAAPLNFIGNIEARDLPLNGCDVAVTDGYTGNIILKLSEGYGITVSRLFKRIFMHNILTKLAALAVKKGLVEFKNQMDYTEYGGAPLLGVSKPTIKAHGSSNEKAIKNAIRQAEMFAKQGVIREIESTLAELKTEE